MIYIRTALSWMLYFLGDMVSQLLKVNALSFIYPCYSWLMVKSLEMQIKNGDIGPWIKPPSEAPPGGSA